MIYIEVKLKSIHEFESETLLARKLLPMPDQAGNVDLRKLNHHFLDHHLVYIRIDLNQ